MTWDWTIQHWIISLQLKHYNTACITLDERFLKVLSHLVPPYCWPEGCEEYSCPFCVQPPQANLSQHGELSHVAEGPAWSQWELWDSFRLSLAHGTGNSLAHPIGQPREWPVQIYGILAASYQKHETVRRQQDQELDNVLNLIHHHNSVCGLEVALHSLQLLKRALLYRVDVMIGTTSINTIKMHITGQT